MDLWFPELRIPVGFGQAAMLPVLVMTLTYSRFLSAVMLPVPSGGRSAGGDVAAIAQVGAVSKTLVWDREAAIGGRASSRPRRPRSLGPSRRGWCSPRRGIRSSKA